MYFNDSPAQSSARYTVLLREPHLLLLWQTIVFQVLDNILIMKPNCLNLTDVELLSGFSAIRSEKWIISI